MPTNEAQSCPGEVPLLTNSNGIENYGGGDSISKKRVMKPRRPKKNRNFEPTQDCARDSQVGPSDWTTRKKMSSERRKRKSR